MIRRASFLTPSLALLVALLVTGAASAAQSRAFVAATDFGTGNLATIALGPPRTVTTNVAPTSPDAVLRWHGGRLYVVNRASASNIQVLDPSNNFALIHQTSVGSGANPHDIVPVSPTRAYVTRYDATDLWIIDPQTGAFLGAISLAGFADADGIPEMDHMALRNGRLYVSIERLDRNNFYAPAGGSQIVVIDVATDAVIDMDPSTPGIQGILLPFQDPITEMVVDPAGRIVVGCVGNFGVADGGVVRIDPITGGVTTEITEAALGGDLSDVAVLDTQHAFAVLSDASFNTALKAYRRDLGTVGPTLVASTGFFLADCEIDDRSELWVCDRDFANPGVRVFDAVTHAELTAAHLDTGPPPQDLTFDGDVALDVPPPAAVRAPLAIASIAPNPSRGPVEIAFGAGGTTAARAVARILDLSGRAVRTMDVAIAGDRPSFTWDGTNDAGERVGAGVYFVRVTVSGGAAGARLVRMP